MKSIRILIVLLTLIIIDSCYEKQFNIYPEDAISAEKLFSTEDGAESALIGIYRSYTCGGIYMFGAWAVEYYGNTGTEGAGNSYAQALNDLALTPANQIARRYWDNGYEQIGRVNNFLYYLDDTPFEDAKRKKAARAEAYFIRTWVYFQIVQLYGDCPLILSIKDPKYPEREKTEKVYEQIIKDLEYCIEHLPVQPPVNIITNNDIEETARPTSWAAKSLLAKILITAPDPVRDLNRAQQLTYDIVYNGPYDLVENYGDLFLVDNKNNSESIYLISLSSHPETGSNLATHSTHSDNWHRPSDSLYKSYDPEDTRRDVNIEPFIKHYYVKKMRYDPNVSLNMCANNFPLYGIRLADIILLRAETLNQIDFQANKSEILSLVNLIRERAYQSSDFNYTGTDIQSKEDAIEIIRVERHKELYYECHLFFDLKRLGKAKEVLGCDDYDLLWPIPEGSITTNPNLVQNPGY